MSLNRKLLSLASLLTLLALPAVAQDEPQDTFAEQMDVTEVLLDVLVTDAQGNIILGLEPQDFIVKEGGKEVDVTGATFYSNRRFVDSADMAERLGLQPGEVPSDRFFILFFHDQRQILTALARNQLHATRKARQWVETEQLPGDYVAVVSYDYKLKIHQDFTQDREKLYRALDEAARGKDPGTEWASRREQHDGPSLAKNLPTGRDLRKATKRIYSALELVAEGAGAVVGRKNLLFFSIGFGEQEGFGTYQPDRRFYPKMMQALNDNNVAVYSISMFENLNEEPEVLSGFANALSVLASDTGGRYFFNFVNFETPLRRIAEDNNGYYLLSYQARHPAGESGYEKVEVATRSSEFVIRAREGYIF